MAETSPDLSLAERIDAVGDQFERDFRAGQQPRLEQFLATADEQLRPTLFRTLLELELELRQKAGERPQIAEYEARFPEQLDQIRQAFEAASRPASMVSSVKLTGVDTSKGPVRAKSAVEAAAPSAPKTLGRFEILSVLGEGAFGTVYRARDPQLDREVAVKVPKFAGQQSREDRERFLREARAAANLHHPQICPVHEVGTIDGRDYIVLAFIDGKPLSKVLQSKPQLSDRQIVAVIRKLALALQEAHDKGIIHRDLKPANIMINRKGEPVIMDFGLARRENSGDAQISHSGQIMGTPAYMSPEQARGDGKAVGPAADIYSLGIVLYELLCGRRPFEGTVTEVIGLILHVDAPPPSEFRPTVDPRLQAICLKAIAKKPGDRFASMKDFATALADFVKAAPATTRPADAAKAEPESADELHTTQFAQLLAAMSSDVESKVERAVRRAGHPPKTPWWTYLAGSGFMGLVILLGVMFFIKSGDTTVIVQISMEKYIDDLKDPALSFLLDNKPIEAAALESPIELKPGEHELIVNRDGKLFKRFAFNVEVGKSKNEPVVVQDVTPEALSPTPTDGFVSLFNGKDLAGWRSTPNGKANWRVEDGQLLAGNAGLDPGERCYLMTTRDDYADYHLRADVKLDESADSGIYLRMQPLPAGVVKGNERGYEVQLNLEPRTNVHAGGLFVAPSAPEQPFAAHREERLLAKPNEWFTLDVTVRNGRITTTINGTTASDYTDPNLRFTRGHIGLQYTRGLAMFRRIEIKEQTTDDGWIDLFNGKDLTGWKAVGTPKWSWSDNRLIGAPGGGGFLMTEADYENFELELQYRLTAGMGSGLFLRTDPNGEATGKGQLEVQIADDDAFNLQPLVATGAVYNVFARSANPPFHRGDWNSLRVRLNQRHLEVWVNGTQTIDANLDTARDKFAAVPGLSRKSGRIALQQNQKVDVEFRQVRIRDLDGPSTPVENGFVPLFNGKDLTGWKRIGPDTWSVRESAVFTSGTERAQLVCDQHFDNFELTGEVYTQPRGNGGICFRVRDVINGQIQRTGYEYQIAGSQGEPGGNYTGSLYAEGAIRFAERRAADRVWSRVRIRAQGGHIQGWIDDRSTFDFQESTSQVPKAGRILALESHARGDEVGYRNLRIRRLTGDGGGQPQIPADAKAFNGHSYKFFPEQLSWKAAESRCEALGGHLVIIEDAAENAFVARLITDGGKVDSWIGATDEGFEGQWHWVDGRNMTWTNWFKRQKQPNNKGGVEHFGLMSNRKLVDGFIGWEWSDQPNESQAQHQPGFVCEWDVIPTVAIFKVDDPDRKAAEYLLSLGGGFVKVNGQDRQIRQVNGLPTGPFHLTGAYFAEVKALDDNGVAVLKDCVHLTELDLRSTRVTEQGLEIFRGKTNFTSLGLAYLRVTDKGLEIFKDNKGLKMLFLHDTFLTDKGLSLFHDCKELGTLWVGGTPITDAGMLPFRDCRFLKWLDVRATKVTRDGVRTMKAALPACRVDVDPDKR